MASSPVSPRSPRTAHSPRVVALLPPDKSLNDLPPEVLRHILEFLPPEQLVRAGRVCALWLEMSRLAAIWKLLYHRAFRNWYDQTINNVLRNLQAPADRNIDPAASADWRGIFWKTHEVHHNWISGKCGVRTFTSILRTVRAVEIRDSILANSSGSSIFLWDLTNSSSLGILRPANTSDVRAFKFFGTDRLVTSAGPGSTQVVFYDIPRQEVLATHTLGQDPVVCLAIDKQQHNILMTGGRQICVWDTERMDAGPLLTVKEQHRGIVNCLELTNNIIYCTHKGKKIRLWDAKSGKRINTIAGHNHLVHCFALNDTMMVSGSKDKTVRIWDRRQNYAPLISLDTHRSSVRAIAVDNWKVVAGSKAGLLSIHNLYDLASPPATINNYDCVYSIAIDDTRALVGSSMLKMYDFANAPKSLLSGCSIS